MHTPELGAPYPLHDRTIDGQQGLLGVCSPLIDPNLLRLFHVQGEIVVCAPPGQAAHLTPVVVSSLLLMRPTTVVSSANLIKRLELCDGMQSWVNSVKRRGLSTHPSGAPVLSMMVLKVYRLRSASQEVQQPVAQRGADPQLNQFMSELL